MEKQLNEPVLPDDYPVNYGYCYVVDGRVEVSDIKGDVKALKADIKSQRRSANEVRRCDMRGRGMF